MLGIGQSDLNAQRIAWRFAAPMLLVLGSRCCSAAPAGAIFGELQHDLRRRRDGLAAAHRHRQPEQRAGRVDGGRQRRAPRAGRVPAGRRGLRAARPHLRRRAETPISRSSCSTSTTTRSSCGPGTRARATLGRVQAAFRPAGGSFGAPQTISGAEPGVELLRAAGRHRRERRGGVDTRKRGGRAERAGRLPAQGRQLRRAADTVGPGRGVRAAGGGRRARQLARGLDRGGRRHARGRCPPSGRAPATGPHRSQVSPAGHDAFSPRVAVDGHNNAIAVWTADADGADPDDPNFIQAALRPAGGSFGAAETISSDVGHRVRPAGRLRRARQRARRLDPVRRLDTRASRRPSARRTAASRSRRRSRRPGKTRSSRASRWTRAPRSCGRQRRAKARCACRVPSAGRTAASARPRRCRSRATTPSSRTSPWTSAATPSPCGPATSSSTSPSCSSPSARGPAASPSRRRCRRPRRPAPSSPRSPPTAGATRSRSGPSTPT